MQYHYQQPTHQPMQHQASVKSRIRYAFNNLNGRSLASIIEETEVKASKRNREESPELRKESDKESTNETPKAMTMDSAKSTDGKIVFAIPQGMYIREMCIIPLESEGVDMKIRIRIGLLTLATCNVQGTTTLQMEIHPSILRANIYVEDTKGPLHDGSSPFTLFIKYGRNNK